MADTTVKIKTALDDSGAKRDLSAFVANANSATAYISVGVNIGKSQKNFNSFIKSLQSTPVKVPVQFVNKGNSKTTGGTGLSAIEGGAHLRADMRRAQVRQETQIRREIASANNAVLERQRAQTLLGNVNKAKTRYSKIGANTKEAHELQEIINSVSMIAEGNGNGAINFKKVNAQWKLFEANAKASGLATKSWGESFKEAAGVVTKFFGAYQVAAWGRRIVSDMKQNVVDINTVMTDLKKVTDATDSQYEKYLAASSDRAIAMSTNLDDYIAATTGFARTGLSIKDSTELGEWATVYYNVGDGVSSVDDATGSLIATMRAFNLATKDAGHIVDIFNKIGNSYAINSGDIGTIMEGSASALSVAGASVEQAVAMGTAMYEVNRNASKTSSTLKTMSLRIRGSKAELIEMGEDTEGMAESTSKLREQVLALTNIDGTGGFDILDETGNFKNFYDIMDGIAQKWVLMDQNSTNAAALLELISGKVRASDTAALLNNFATARRALVDATESEGSAMEEYSKWQTSIEAKQKKINAQVQKLSINLIGDNTVGTVYDLFSGILDIVNSITTTLGSWGTIIGAISPALLKMFPQLMAFRTTEDFYGNTQLSGGFGLLAKRNAKNATDALNSDRDIYARMAGMDRNAMVAHLASNYDKLSVYGQSVADTLDVMADGDTAIVAFGQKMNQVNNQVHKGTGIFKGFNGSIIEVGKNFLSMAASMAVMTAVSIAIGFIVNKISDLVRSTELAVEAAGNMKAKWDELGQSQKNAANVVSEVGSRFEELREGVDPNTNANLSLTEEQYKEYLDLSNKIGDAMPDLVSTWDAQGNAVIRYTDNIQNLNDALAEYNRNIRQQRIDELSRVDENGKTGYEGAMAMLFAKGSGSYIKWSQLQYAHTMLSSITDEEAKALGEYYASNISGGGTHTKLSESAEQKIEAANSYLENVLDLSNEAFANFTNFRLGHDTQADGYSPQKIISSIILSAKKDMAQLERDMQQGRSLINAALLDYLQNAFEQERAAYDLSGLLYDRGWTEQQKIVAQNLIPLISTSALGKLDASDPNAILKYAEGLFTELDENRELVSAIAAYSTTTADYARGKVSMQDVREGQEALAKEITKIPKDSNLEDFSEGLVDEYKLNEAYGTSFINALVEQAGIAEAVVLSHLNEITAPVQKAIQGMINNGTIGAFDGDFDAVMSEANAAVELTETLTGASEAYESFVKNRQTAAEILGKESLSVEDWDALKAAGYGDAVEFDSTSGQYKLNYGKYSQKAREDGQRTLIELAEARAKAEAEYNAQIEKGNKAVQEQNKEQAELALNAAEAAKAQLNAIELLEAQTKRSMSALQMYLEASNKPEIGDAFRATKSALDDLEEGLESGRINTNKFNAALRILYGEAADSWDEKTMRGTLRKDLDKYKSYYGEDGQFNYNGVTSDWKEHGILAPDDSGRLKFTTNSIAEIAEIMGISKEFAGMTIGAYQEHTGDDLSDWFKDSELIGKGVESELSMNTSALSDLKDAINALTKTLGGETPDDKELDDGEPPKRGEGGNGGEPSRRVDEDGSKHGSGRGAQFPIPDNDSTIGVAITTEAKDNGAKAITDGKTEVVVHVVADNNLPYEDPDPEEVSLPVDKEVNLKDDAAKAKDEELKARIQQTATKPVAASTTSANSAVDALIGKVKAGADFPIRPKIFGFTLPGFAKGTKGAPAGEALVAEEGPEIIVSRKTGQWRLASTPQITTLGKGDIVFNASDTEKILRGQGNETGGRSYAAGSALLKALASGNALAKGYWTGQQKPPTVPDAEERKKKGKGGGGGARSSGGSGGDVEEDTRKFFDHIERALEIAKKTVERLIKEAEKKIGYIAKNTGIDKALEATRNEIEKNQAGYERYQKHLKFLEGKYGFSASQIDNLKNGIIDIREYSSEEQQNIQDYMDWQKKAEECLKTVEELKEKQYELNLSKLDNVLKYYDYLIDRQKASLELSEAERDYRIALGKEISESDYARDVAAVQKTIEQLQKSYATYQKQFNELVSSGVLEEDSDKWHEYTGKMEELAQKIVEAKTEAIELNNEIADIPLTKLEYALARLSAAENELSNTQDFHDAQGTKNTAASYVALIQNGLEQIANLERQNAYLYEQQAGLDILSERWQDIQDSIDDNLESIWDIKSAQEEWNDAIADLNIERLREEREELDKTNEALRKKKDMQQAIEDLEKAKTQRTKLIFREGIGYVYEADQDAIKEAQERLDELRHQETLDKIDEAIEAIEKAKETDNVYNYAGSDVIKDITQIDGAALYEQIRDTLDIEKLLADKAIENAETRTLSNNTASVMFQFGNIMLYGVEDVDSLANAITRELPNKIVQQMYSR